MEVAAGIDSHKFNLGIGVTDTLGRKVGMSDFENVPDQWVAMLEWARGFGELTLIGVEGSGQYGSGLVEWLTSQGLSVKEVPAHMTFVERKRKPSNGKSDPTDGISIARVLLREADRLPDAGRDRLAVDLKALVEYRDQLVRSRTQEANRLHALLSTICPGACVLKTKLTTSDGLTKAMATVRGDHQVRAELVRLHVKQIRALTKQIARAQVIVKGLVEESGSCLTAEIGVGPLIAAKIIAEVKSMGSVNSKAGFAMLSGTAPLPASSGQVTRHRLNRGGNRRLNHAIHMVAVTRLRLDPESKSYFERKLTEGKSKREAMRSLKRQIANRLFRCLERDARRAGMVHPQSGS